MRRNKRLPRHAAGALLLLILAALPTLAAPRSAADTAAAASELEAARGKCVAAARATSQTEGTVQTLAHDADLLGRDAAGRQRGLDESRVEQAELLGEIERIARHPPVWHATGPLAPLDRLRAEMLFDAVVPALRAEAAALAAEIDRVAALRAQVAAHESALAAARGALAKNREDLLLLIRQRQELDQRLAPADPGAAARIVKLAHEATNVGDLVLRADAAADRYDKELAARSRPADPTRPRDLRIFEPSFSVLTTPVTGAISRKFGDSEPPAAASAGIAFGALPGAEIVAPFDGRVVFAGPFGNLGLVLIIRHGGLYHSVLAGLGRADVRVDGWVVAGEPVGAMPSASDGALYLELRREGRPVDPQPWLAARDQERGGPDTKPEAGGKKVSE